MNQLSKESPVKWLPEIPHRWEFSRFKAVLKEVNERSEDGSEELLSVSEHFGVKPRHLNIDDTEHLTRADTLEGYKKCEPDDLVMNIMLAWKCGQGVSNYSGIVSPAYSVYRPDKTALSPHFLHYLVRTPIYTSYFKSFSSGIMDSRLRLYPDKFMSLYAILPPIEEQAQIAAYLDSETTRIDGLITEKQKFINLLKEKRQALISHFVSKGLDANVPMKDSGVEWIGEVPEHWEVRYSKWLFSERNVKATAEDEQLTASQKYGVLPQKLFMELENQKVVQVILNPEILKKVEKDDFVISMRSFQGGLEHSKYSGSISSAYVPLYPCLDVDTPYFKYLFKSKSYIQALQSTSDLIRDGQALRYKNFIKVDLPLPPLIEQKQISNYIEQQVNRIDNLIEATKESVELLSEHRTALISAAVTGKIDVRGMVDTKEGAA